MNRSIHSKFLAFLLALVMVFSMLPVSALAAEETATYVKVAISNASDVTAGTYLIYGISSLATDDGKTSAFMSTKDSTSSRLMSADLVISDGTVSTSDENCVWKLIETDGGFYIQNAGNSQYLYYGSKTGNNIYQTSDKSEAGVWAVVPNGDGWTLKENESGRQLSCNRFGSSGSYYLGFAAYDSTSSTKRMLEFYKLESSTEPEKETVAKPTASPAPGAVAAGTEVTFSCATEGAVIQYHTGDSNWITASKAVVNAATTFTVKATKDGMNDSAVATFAYTVATEEPVEPSDTIADGSYVIWEAGNGKAATALEQSKTYGYLQTVDVTQTEAGLTGCTDTEIWTITNVSDGQFTVQDANGKYYYMTGSYNSFNVAADAPASGYLWTAAANEDGTWAITNAEMGKTIAYDTDYTSFGAYAEPTEKQLTALTLTPASEIVKPEEPEEPETPEQPKRYVGVKISSMEELVSGKYVLVASNGYAPTTLDSGWILAEAVTPADGKIVNPADNLVWMLTVDGSGVTLTDSNGVSIAPKGGNNNGIVSGSYSWAVTCTDGVFQFAGQGSDIVLLASNTGSDNKFRAYKTETVSKNPNGYPSEFTLYKLEPARESGVVTDLSTLQDGDTVVVFNPANAMALSTSYTGYYNQGTAVTLTDGVLTGYTDADIWTLGINEDGTYTFSTVEGKKLSMGASYTSTPLDDVNVDWNITAAETKDCVYIQNAARGNYLEWYASKENWSTYTKISDEALFAQQIYLVVEEAGSSDTSLPVEGDQVVIYNLSAKGVLAAQSDNESIENALTEIVDGKAVPGNGGVIFTVKKNGDYYRFFNETYGYLCSNGTGNNAFYSLEESEDADWKLSDGKSGGYNMESRTAKYNGQYSQYLEYYADSYKTYSMYNVTDYDIYEFFFYGVADGVNVTDGIVNAPGIDFGTLADAFIHTDYTFSFTVDAVFGVDGDLTVKVGETKLTINEDGSYTIPAELVEGESLTITVSGVDTKGVAITGSTNVTVLDMPVIDEVTPASGEQTGDVKRPTISAKISNAGENPTVTMTVNGEEVAAVYNAEAGLVSYTADEDMADGRTTVTVTVVRADEKEASKSWSFVVGKSRYQLYFGQLHSHTTFSDGSGSLDSALDYVANLPDSANVDFVAFTDHSNYFDTKDAVNPESALYDMTQATAYSQETWAKYKNTVAAFNDSQAKIVAVAGFEMTWSGGPGHINTFNTPGIVSRNNSTLNNKTDDAGLKAYYALLSQPAGADSLSQLNHPGSTFGTFADFAYWDPVIDSRVFLVEVGNGEGAIGAGGYYPSYEYYTMALDKGWHVAPTNNQDNHKGKWGNANDARDVVLTDDFTEAGIYQAIRDMRVYATEDKNLEITYTLNGYQLGSSIDVPEKVNIEVTVNDPDSNDSISKVEVVVNSGKVIHTWNDPTQLATGALSVELDPDYSYYYIRVTEGDGDLAVTAPVWVGESLKLGISSLECGTATPVTNEELTLTTTLFNSEAMEATVKSVTYTTNGSEVLGTDKTGYTVPASGTLAVEFAYTPTVAKVMTITATVVLEQDSKEYTFTKDIELDVLDADALVYFGIDASHHNEYVAGNYKDSMGNFGTLAAEYSVRTVQLNTSEDLIAACSNEKYKAIVLTAPSRRDGSALRNPYDTYSAAEIEALVAFNNAGGTVVLCGWGDYYESYSEFPDGDHMAAQQNKILEALGSSIRISDDETKDDTYNGGQSQRLYLSSYNFDSFLLEGVEYDPENPHNNMYTELYSQYGGASIYTVDAQGNPSVTVPGTVTPVVFGFETTYSADDDKDNYGGLGSVPKYSFDGAERLMVMASEQLEGKGLIVVAGAAFLSNFEVQAKISDSGSEKNYSNYKICENLLQALNPVTVTDIATVRAQTEVGYKYTIEGVVTSNASGYDKNTAFFDCIYVQDATGGICCFPVAGEFKIGDVVRVTGTTDFFQGEPELQITGIQKIGEIDPVVPTTVSAAQINDRSAEGKLVTVSGTVESFELANGLVQTIMVKDAEGNVARVFIDGYITTAKDVENLAVGNEITATGLASYDDTFNAPEGPFPRIRIRNRADVVCTIAKHDCDLEGHGWDEGKVTKEPTCTEEGEKTYPCQYCGKTKTEQIGALGHDWDEGQVTKEPTCTEAGEKTYTCQRCQDTCTEEISALGHSYVDGTCERCGEKDPDSVPTTPVKPIWKSWLDRLLEKLHDIISKPNDPVKPPKPHWGGIFDWIPGLWK